MAKAKRVKTHAEDAGEEAEEHDHDFAGLQDLPGGQLTLDQKLTAFKEAGKVNGDHDFCMATILFHSFCVVPYFCMQTFI